MNFLPLEITDRILGFAIEKNESKDSILDTDLWFLFQLQLVCWGWKDILDHSTVWKTISKGFPDFEILEKRQIAKSVHWKQVCKDRINNNFIMKSVSVGNVSNPKSKYLIHVSGSNKLYISNLSYLTEDTKLFMGQYGLLKFDNDIYQQLSLPITENIKIPLPVIGTGEWAVRGTFYFTDNVPSEPAYLQPMSLDRHHMSISIQNEFYRFVQKHHMNPLFVIDVSVFDPFVLILTNRSSVIELMFVQELSEGRWWDFREPRIISINAKILRVFAFDFGNIAIDENHNVWVWTALEHPFPDPAILETQKKIRADPLLLDALSKYNIVHCEPGIADHTRMFYTNDDSSHGCDNFKTLPYLDVPNVQMIAMIAEQAFTPEILEQLVDRINE